MEFDLDDEDFDEREDKFSSQGFLPPLKESLVFLVDAQSSMLQRANVKDLAVSHWYLLLKNTNRSLAISLEGSEAQNTAVSLSLADMLIEQGFDEADSWLEISLKVITGLFKEHIISSPSDSLALVFYSTKETHNASNLDNVYVFQELDQPTAHSIRAMDKLFGPYFSETIGSSSASSSDSLINALWTAHTMLSKGPRASKRTLIFSDDLDPSGGNSTKREQVLARVEQMKSIQAEIDLFPMVLTEDFNYQPFWAAIVGTDDDSENSTSELPNRLQALNVTVRQRAYKRRVLCRSSLAFSDSFHISVSLYALLQPAVKSAYKWVHRQDLGELRSETALICADTGAVLTEVNKLTFPNVEASKPQPSIPKLIISKDDMQTLKNSGPPGLRLLGFKPMNALLDYHQVRNPSFLYPDEAQQSGSTTAFVALHQCLLDEDCFALASFIRTRGAEPHLVALLAQQETRDSYGNQIEPPGINLIYLPYADDIRSPERDPSFVGAHSERATADQVELAEAMMQSLQMYDFDCCEVPNPVLQRHFQALETMALGEPVPEDIEDLTRPDTDGMQSAHAEVLAFKDAVYGPGNDEGGAVKSRGAGGGAKRKPDASAEAAASEIDFRGLAAQAQLGTLTVADLKTYCAAHKLARSGKKADLLDRVEKHLDV